MCHTNYTFLSWTTLWLTLDTLALVLVLILDTLVAYSGHTSADLQVGCEDTTQWDIGCTERI
jgi:hypothetical protein